MRKVMMIVVMLLISVSVFGQNVISEMDGFDWLNWSEERRFGYVEGFMAGHAALRDRFAYEGMDDTNMSDEYFYIPTDTATIVERLNAGYSDYETRKIPIHFAIYIAVAKDYWSTSDSKDQEQNNGQRDPNEVL